MSTARAGRLAAKDRRHNIVSTSVESGVDVAKFLQIARLDRGKRAVMLVRSPVSKEMGFPGKWKVNSS